MFANERDYRRFLLLLYLGNDSSPLQVANLLKSYDGQVLSEIFEKEKSSKSLVDILAYCLMPNHFHLVLRQKETNGITRFMKKIATAYAMYFNLKNNRSGVFLQGRFQSRHVNNEAYFRYIFAYVHLNPLELIEPKWKENRLLMNESTATDYIRSYPYSSYYDYVVGARPERSLLTSESIPDFLRTSDDFKELLNSFYQGPSSVIGDRRKTSAETVVG